MKNLQKHQKLLHFLAVGLLISAIVTESACWIIPMSLILILVGIIKLILQQKSMFIIAITGLLLITMLLNYKNVTSTASLLQYSLTALMVHYMILHHEIKF